MGLHRAGFEVTGVDIEPQPRYPFKFIRADALAFDFAGYDIVWTSPICHPHSNLNFVNRRAYPETIAPMRARLASAGVPYIIENVKRGVLINPVMLCGQMFGLKVFRHRYFESNVPLTAPAHAKHDGATGTHRWPYKPVNGYLQVTGSGSNFTLAEGRRAMGIPWMSRAELTQAIPPDFSEFLGRQLMAYLTGQRERAA
jgi:DNA (cytosine-5)-methyltransferase 1